MKLAFQKVKTEHHILTEFHAFLRQIEQSPLIARIIPWRINRQQKASSELRFTVSYPTTTGFKAKMSKGATSQELFIIAESGQDLTAERLLTQRNTFIS